MISNRLNLQNAFPTKKLILLGASGSVGLTTLEYLRRNKSIQLEGISVHNSIDKIDSIINEFSPRFVSISNEEKYEEYKNRKKNSKVKFFSGKEGILEMLEESSCDTVLIAVVGASGVQYTLKSIELNKKICLANKESLIIAGDIIIDKLKQYHKSSLLPVDSEHNSTLQLLLKRESREIKKIILTASGGPFRDYTLQQIKNVSKEEVLKHPTWKMGPKITVDSAGLINKGLEVIEAHYLFGIDYENIEVKIHKSSFVHAMIQLTDGSYILSVSPPNMIYPIAHSLHFPEPVPFLLKESLEPENWPALDFYEVDNERYPGFRLCIEAGKKGGLAPTVLNASNEKAVEYFLKDKIYFTQIVDIIRDALENIPVVKAENIDIILKVDKQTREYVDSKFI